MHKLFTEHGVIAIAGTITDVTDTTMTVTVKDTTWDKTTKKSVPVPPVTIGIPAGSDYMLGNTFAGLIRADLENETQYQIIKDTELNLGVYKIPRTDYALLVTKNNCTFEREKATKTGGTMKTSTAMCWLPYEEKSTDENPVYMSVFLSKPIFAEKETVQKNGKSFQHDSRDRQLADELLYAGLTADGNSSNTIVAVVKTTRKDFTAAKTVPYTFGGKSGLTYPSIPVEVVAREGADGKVSYSVSYEPIGVECFVFDESKEQPKPFKELTKEEIQANRLTALNYQPKNAKTAEVEDELPFGDE